MIVRIALVGDHDAGVTAHRAIPEALRLAAEAAGVRAEWRWHHTRSLAEAAAPIAAPIAALADADAVWLVPASPYASTAGALGAVRLARESGLPFVGTCGGFQHALLEYAGAVWGVARPAHAELEPGADDPVIAPLACSLVEETGLVRFAPASRLAILYGREQAREGYHCRYGLSPRWAARLADGPLRAAAWDEAGDVRAVELDGHPFFVATLFQPERAALRGEVPPLARGLVEAARRHAERRAAEEAGLSGLCEDGRREAAR